MKLLPTSVQEKLSQIGSKGASVCGSSGDKSRRHLSFVAHRRTKKNKDYVPFLASEWPGSILNWSDQDLADFSGCFRIIQFDAAEEIPIPCGSSDHKFFFIVVDGAVEINALLPTKCRKTDNVREFLCKKSKGDMVYMPSVRTLISESSAKEIYEREAKDNKAHVSHKNVLELIDTVCIKSVDKSTLLQLDWTLFHLKFHDIAARPEGSLLDVSLLRTIMNTNLTDYLANIPILNGIGFSKLETLSRLCSYRVIKKGDTVFKEGDPGDEAYIILSGEVRVDAMASKYIIDIMQKETTTASANCDTEESISEGERMKRKGSVITSCDYVQEASPSISSEGGRKSIISRGQMELVARRRTLLKAGAQCLRDADKCDIDVSGGGERNSNDKSRTVELAMLSRGDYVGEMAAFIDLPRAATVTAESNVLLAALSKTSFRTLYHSISPELETVIEAKIRSYMLRNIFDLKSPLQQQIGLEQSIQMAAKSAIVRYDQGGVIFTEGEEEIHFYFIYTGTLGVEKKLEDPSSGNTCIEKCCVGTLFPGDYFGEGTLINNRKCLATVTATTDVVVLKISRTDFVDCFADNPGLIAELVVRTKGKSVDLVSTLAWKRSRDSFAAFHSNAGNNTSDLLFYEDILDFEKTFRGMTLNTWRLAKDLFDQYITEGGQLFVDDLDADIVKAARNCVEFETDAEVTKGMFGLIKKELHQRIELVFKDYKKDRSFVDILSQIRALDNIDIKMLA